MASRPTIRDVDARWQDRVAATIDAASEQSRARARELRASMQLPEVLLWRELRGRKLSGLKFRRQHVLGPYFADFYCHELRLVIEVDGFESHRARQEHDRVRDNWMSARGLVVLRLSASLILDNMPRALWLIAERAKDLQLQSEPQ
jgi:very-short-patch-repair endonuclease